MNLVRCEKGHFYDKDKNGDHCPYCAQMASAASSAPAPAPAAAPVPPPAPAAASGSGTVIAAPVAGTLLKNVVAEGAAVKSGDTIIMIESMKMELEIKASVNGTVHFLAAAGTQITAGQALAEIK